MQFSLFVIAALSATSSSGMVSAAAASVSRTRKTGKKNGSSSSGAVGPNDTSSSVSSPNDSSLVSSLLWEGCFTGACALDNRNEGCEACRCDGSGRCCGPEDCAGPCEKHNRGDDCKLSTLDEAPRCNRYGCQGLDHGVCIDSECQSGHLGAKCRNNLDCIVPDGLQYGVCIDDICQSGESNDSSLVSYPYPEPTLSPTLSPNCFTNDCKSDLSNYGCSCIVSQSATRTVYGTCMDAQCLE